MSGPNPTNIYPLTTTLIGFYFVCTELPNEKT